MYELYLEDCAKRQCGVPVKLSYYRHIFNTEFNLEFHHPVKEQCDLCVSYRNSNVIRNKQCRVYIVTFVKR